MTSQPTPRPGWRPLLMAVWGVVAIAAGPVILVAELAHGFGSLMYSGEHWAAFALMVTPLLAPLGVVLAVTLRPDDEDAADEAADEAG